MIGHVCLCPGSQLTQQTQWVLRREFKMLALPLLARHQFEPQLLSGGSDSPQLMGPLRGWRGVRTAGIQYLAGCLAVADLSLLLWLKLPLNRSHLVSPALPFQGKVHVPTATGLDSGSQLRCLQSPGIEPQGQAQCGPCHLPQGPQRVQAACAQVWAKDPHTGLRRKQPNRGPKRQVSGCPPL